MSLPKIKKFSQCAKCKHYLKERKCHAFPEGIPANYLNNQIRHDKVVPNQVGDYLCDMLDRWKRINRKREENRQEIIENKAETLKKLPSLLVAEIKILSFLDSWEKITFELRNDLNIVEGKGYSIKTEELYIFTNEEKIPLLFLQNGAFAKEALLLFNALLWKEGNDQISLIIYPDGNYDYKM